MKRIIASLLLVVGANTASAQIVESVNASDAPGLGASYQFAASNIGWYFTPTLSYSLTGVNFHFGTTDGRTVTEQIFTQTPALGGTLLGSASFVPGAMGFYGASFSPISFVAGTTYFIGLLNVYGFDGMISSVSGATILPVALDAGSGHFDIPCDCPSGGKVMMQLVSAPTTTVTPEPGTMGLLAAGLFGIIGVGRVQRRRKTARVR